MELQGSTLTEVQAPSFFFLFKFIYFIFMQMDGCFASMCVYAPYACIARGSLSPHPFFCFVLFF